MADLSDKEYLLLQTISHRANASQRELAEACALSLGLTNLLLNRLLRNNLIMVQALNLKKRQYRLTDRGFIEHGKARTRMATRSYHEYKRLSTTIRANVLEEYGRGLRSFVIAAPPEIESLVREVLEELKLPEIRYVFEPDLQRALTLSKTVFTAGPAMEPGNSETRIVSLLEPQGLVQAAARN